MYNVHTYFINNLFIYFLGSPLHRKAATHVQEEERRKILKMLVTPQVKNFVQPFVLPLPTVTRKFPVNSNE